MYNRGIPLFAWSLHDQLINAAHIKVHARPHGPPISCSSFAATERGAEQRRVSNYFFIKHTHYTRARAWGVDPPSGPASLLHSLLASLCVCVQLHYSGIILVEISTLPLNWCMLNAWKNLIDAWKIWLIREKIDIFLVGLGVVFCLRCCCWNDFLDDFRSAYFWCRLVFEVLGIVWFVLMLVGVDYTCGCGCGLGFRFWGNLFT